MTSKAKTIGTALTRAKAPAPTMDGLENAVAGMGGSRDKMSYGSWELGRILGRFELENMYRSSWLARKIITIPADDMTREWRTLAVEKDDGTAKKAFEKAERKFLVKAKIHEALLWGRLYGGALLIIGTKDGMRDPSKPLNVESIKKGDLKYLQVIDRWRVSPGGTLTKDITSPNFNLPETYLIADSAVQIHWTRVVRFGGTKLPYFSWQQNSYWDDSVLMSIMDSLQSRETSTKAVATMMFEANVDVISGVGIAEMLAAKGGEAKLIRRFQTASLMKSFNRTLLLDQSEVYDKKSNAFANLDKIMQEFMSDVSGAADIPVTRLFGQSPAGLNATGEADTRNYYDRISNNQETDLRPQLEYLDQVLYRSEIGEPPEDMDFDFNPLWQMSDAEVATIEKTQAETDQIYIAAGVLHAGNVARELMDRKTYVTLTDADVELVDELAKPLDGDPADDEIGMRETKAKAPAAAMALGPDGEPLLDPDGNPIPAPPGEQAIPPKPGAAKPVPPKE